MKRILALLLSAILLLAGCSSTPDSSAPTENKPSENTNVATEGKTDVLVPLMPMITVSLPVTVEEVTADDGTVILQNIRQSMQLVMPDQEVADRIIIDFLARIDRTSSTQQEVLSSAQRDYKSQDYWTSYMHSITYAPKRVDQSVLSLYGSYYTYSGGAHGMHSSCAANYNTLTGDVLTLGSIVVSEASVDTLCDIVITKLQAVAEEKHLRNGFEDTVRQRFAGEESYDEAWYFSQNGLCFYFVPYEIGPFASGVITVEIPYAELIGIIDDSFFPPETEVATGSIKTISAEQAVMSDFTRISELVLTAEAPMYVIYPKGSVQNLKIEWTDAKLGGTYTVFASQFLSTGDAIVVQANPNLFSTLSIIYESNDQITNVPLLP